MQKKLFTQIRNEWRGNLWLALELLVVSVVMWYIVDLLYCNLATYLEPRGFDTEHCYLVKMGLLTDKSPDYRPDADEKADVLALAERLRHRPEVEAVSLSQNSYPYNVGNATDGVSYDSLKLKGELRAFRRLVSPDFVRVFRYRGTRGETPDQLADVLRDNNLIVSDDIFRVHGIESITPYVGRRGFHAFSDTTTNLRLGAALQPVRYDDYTQARASRTYLFNIASISGGSLINSQLELCVRVKDDQDRDFIESLKADSEAQYRIGNVYISDIRSFTDIRRNYQQSHMNQLRNYCIGMGFLLLNIFLGLLGTFWFRTQQRRGEIGPPQGDGAANPALCAPPLTAGALLPLPAPGGGGATSPAAEGGGARPALGPPACSARGCCGCSSSPCPR